MPEKYKEYKAIKGSFVLESIISAKKNGNEKQELDNCKKLLVEDYKKYEANKYALQNMNEDKRAEFTPEAKELLRNTYKGNKPRALNNALDKIEELLPKQLGVECPYCRLSEYGTYDHYLEKSKYPEYTLLPLNLIPCCSKCNSKKGDELTSPIDNTRMFINFRFDQLPSYDFLECVIDFNDGVPYIKEYRLTFDKNEPLEKTIRYHFDKLDLYRRIRKRAENTLIEIVNLCTDTTDTTFLKSELNRILNSKEKAHGKNYWDACVYRAVLSDSKVLTGIVSYSAKHI